jgi:hypothetical protein
MTLNCRFFRKDIVHSVDHLHSTQEMRSLKKLLYENSNLGSGGGGGDDGDNDDDDS